MASGGLSAGAQYRGCGRGLPAPFLDLGRQPLANALVDPARAHEPEPCYPLAVCAVRGCDFVQLERTLPPEALFSEYVYFSSYSDTFLAHSREMARALSDRFRLGSSSRVLEVASNDGYLLQYFQADGIPVLGVEPAGNIAAAARQRGIPTLQAFFSPALVAEIQRDSAPPTSWSATTSSPMRRTSTASSPPPPPAWLRRAWPYSSSPTSATSSTAWSSTPSTTSTCSTSRSAR